MARQPRGVQAGRTYLVMQRGHGHQPFARDGEDHDAYLTTFFGAAFGQGLWVHGWAALGTMALFLVSPQRPTALSATLQQLGRQYAQTFNRRWQQRGSPWDGRFRSAWVGDDLSLAALVWLDQRVGLAASEVSGGDSGDWLAAARRVDYPWSSGGLLSGQRSESLPASFRPLASYWALGNTPFERERAYGQLLDAPSEAAFSVRLEQSLRSGRPLLSPAEWHRHPDEALLWPLRPRGRPAQTRQAVEGD